jgi:uncharacterized protein
VQPASKNQLTIREAASTTELVAPWWYTIALVMYLAAPLSVFPFGERIVRLVRNLNPPLVYAPYLLAQWATFGLAWLGLSLKHTRIRDLIDSGAPRRPWLGEIPVVFLFWILAVGGTATLYLLIGSLNGVSPLPLPSTPLALLAFLPLAVTAGFCEEVVFRGYLLTQISVLIGFPGSLIVQAAFFSLVHGYHQTAGGFIQKFLLGIMFGLLIHWRKSLVPAIMAHIWLDLSGGIISVILSVGGTHPKP